MRTMDAECGDEDLRDALRTVLNTREYADKVASQLYHEQWTLASLQSISPSRLEDVLRHMRVFLSFSSTPRFPPPPPRSQIPALPLSLDLASRWPQRERECAHTHIQVHARAMPSLKMRGVGGGR